MNDTTRLTVQKLKRLEKVALDAIHEDLFPDECPDCDDGGNVMISYTISTERSKVSCYCQFCKRTFKAAKVTINITPVKP